MPLSTGGPYAPLYGVPWNERCTFVMPPTYALKAERHGSVFTSAHCQRGGTRLVRLFDK